ncbi:LysR family transcriptional regulator [Phenylobacterium sp.]|uniref:LysR family transcriptional regulator n=1 Tax=Phenylobacterium sp. TaxID=1871053 RepID=UPI0028A2BC80|nr:LysR family transcriptional regulator [Phenylobacterium sp.]
MRLDLERVLRFVVVARELSFTRAAARLRIDQPWLSRQMMQLEGQLGFALFKREGGRILLTPDGEEFLGYAERLTEVAEETCQKAEEMQRRHKSDLRIGVAYFTYWFPRRTALLERFKEIRPGVNLEVTMAELSDGVLGLVRNSTVDVGLLVGPVDEPDMEQIRIECGHTTLSIPEEDPLAHAASVALSDLRGRRVAVGTPVNPARHAITYGWVDKVGAEAVVILEGRRFMADVAERERLILLNLASEEKVPSSFVRRPIRGPKPRADLYLVRRKGVTSSAVDRFWRLGEEIGRKRAPVEAG